MKYIASCSFGKDSLAMVLKLLELKEPLDEVIFFDTGMEFQAIYNLRDKMKPILKEAGVKFVELHPKDSFEYMMFDKPINGWKNGFHVGYGWCGGACRWGTYLKREAITKYLASLKEPYLEYIGIAADEPERIREKNYPLVRWNMTEADCLAYCYSKGFNWLERSTPPETGLTFMKSLTGYLAGAAETRIKKNYMQCGNIFPIIGNA